MKIDVFPHFIPAKYKKALLAKATGVFRKQAGIEYIESTPALYDLTPGSN